MLYRIKQAFLQSAMLEMRIVPRIPIALTGDSGAAGGRSASISLALSDIEVLRTPLYDTTSGDTSRETSRRVLMKSHTYRYPFRIRIILLSGTNLEEFINGRNGIRTGTVTCCRLGPLMHSSKILNHPLCLEYMLLPGL